MSFMRMNRSLLAASCLSAGLVLGTAPSANADVNVGASIVIPFTNGMVSINVGDTLYRFYDGFFYRPMDDGHHYKRVKAPRGALVPNLPKNAKHSKGMYQVGDTYFRHEKDGYRVIDPKEMKKGQHANKGHQGKGEPYFTGEPESRRNNH